MRKALTAVVIATACVACRSQQSPAATPAEAGAAQDAQADVAAGETGPGPCTAAQVSACDDGDPCTQDPCSPGGGCAHAPAPGAPCDDADPCTVSDVCGDKGCKGEKKSCDDGSPCTTDVCQTGGNCTHAPNQHYDCVPLIAVDHPPRGYRWVDPNGLLAVTGKLVSQKAKATALTVQGKPVPLAADGAFSTQVQLTPGATRLVLVATDDKGGTRTRVQGVHWAQQWHKGAVPHGAVGLGAQLPAAWQPNQTDAWAALWTQALADATFSVPAAWSGPATWVQWPLQAVPAAMGVPGCAGVLALTGQPAPKGVAAPLAATAATDPGTPDLCAPHNLSADFVNDPKAMQLVLTDVAWNAALRAAWLGGALAGDVSPTTAALGLPVEIAAAAQLRAPWLLRSCGPEGPRLDLVDLRVHLRAPADLGLGVLAEGDVHIAVRVQPVVKMSGSKVQLWIGPAVSVAADLDLVSGAFFETDIQEGLVVATVAKAVPKLLEQWAKAPLAELPLPTSAQVGGAQVQWSWGAPLALAGAVRVHALPK
ncbi:MAG: hypothetical protein FJ100_19430 [Deltaproteobacteria bacterium]|nr:hypothetical protein [Deltaproteobacteria bacterium]